MTKAEKERTERLLFLESWARARYPSQQWPTPEFKAALEELCLYKWAVPDGTAKNMARIVQIRMTKVAPKVVSRTTSEASPESEAGMSLEEIISGYRKANPEEFKAPVTDFHVIEE